MHPPERLNTLTHFAGALLALLGSILLVSTAVKSGDAIRIAAFAVFGAALVILYTCSTLYHGARGNAKQWLRKLDHCAIYILIAGTYAPFALVALRGWFGFALLLAVCVLSCIGIALVGWLGIVAVKPLIDALGATGFAWLVAGGLLYTFGLIFYALDTRLRHAHGIWHMFVMGGSAAHVGAVLYFV
jgi:hemolysin III